MYEMGGGCSRHGEDVKSIKNCDQDT